MRNLMTRCWLSETHLAINPQGNVGPCCRHNGKATGVSINSRTIDQVFENPKLLEIRSKLQSGERLKDCSKCWKQEDSNILSMRQQYNTYADWKSLETLTTFERIHSLEIAFSNHCNYRCRMCNSWFSSKWRDDDILLNRKVPESLLEPNIDFYQIEKLVNLRHIKMLGGEPFLSKQHKHLLKRIPVNQVEIEYVTNGSIWPDSEVIEIWKQAKSLRFIISLDDIESQFEYFRSDSNFKTVENTLDNIEKIRSSTTVTNIHCVINVLNMYRLDKVVSYILDKYPNWNFTFDTIVEPDWLKVDQWSKYEAEIQIKKLQTIKNAIPTVSSINRHKIRNIEKAITILKTQCINEVNQFSQFVNTNSILDKSRNTNFKNIHPYLAGKIQ